MALLTLSTELRFRRQRPRVLLLALQAVLISESGLCSLLLPDVFELDHLCCQVSSLILQQLL